MIMAERWMRKWDSSANQWRRKSNCDVITVGQFVVSSSLVWRGGPVLKFKNAKVMVFDPLISCNRTFCDIMVSCGAGIISAGIYF